MSRRSFVKRVLPAVIAATLAAGATTASAVEFQGVYIFGDSLSDAGYYRPFLLSIGVPSATTATLGRFTTNPGPVWSEIIAQYYGGNANPSNVAGGGIFAQGGARVAAASTSTPPGGAQRPVTTQITEHFANTGGAAISNALYAIWAGGNDLLQAGAAGVASANDVAAQSARLRGAGARYVAVFGLPNLGLTPGAQAGGAAGVALQTQASAGFNITLFNALAATNQRVISVDTFSMLNEVAANPAVFGFTNITGRACGPFPPFSAGGNSQFCTGSTLVAGATPNNYLFADSIHPTSGAHAIVADLFKSLIDGPNAYSTMAEVPLSSRAAHVRTLDSGLMQGATADVGKVSAFAAYDGSKFDLSMSSFNPQTNTKNHAATVGATIRVSNSVTVGVAAGKNNNEARMGSVGQFDVDETTLSFFGNAEMRGFYANASFSVADLKFNNVQRFVKLGNVTRTNNASTNGTNASGNIMVGYDHSMGNITFGPFVGWTSQQVTVGGFQENATATTALSTDLKLDGQSRNARVLSVGLRGSVKVGNFTPYARVSFDRDEANTERFVTASPVTITQGIKYDIPAYRGDSSWVTGVIGVRGNITPQIGLGLAYTAISSKQGVKQDGVTANINFAF